MRNFIIIFAEKEGTSPLVRLLNNFDQISIVHQADALDWEPFDIQNRGAMTLRDLEHCLDMIYCNDTIDFDQLNQIYTRTAKSPIEEFGGNGAAGFKMRFTTPRKDSPFWNRLPKDFTDRSFRLMMFNVLKRNDVIVFLALRQDILKWALSKYHGDGTGKPGHIQFRLASGKIKRNAIGNIHVDCKRLEMIISKCVESHARKSRLMEDFKQAGIQTHSLIYEDFLADRQKCIDRISKILELNTSKEETDAALTKGTYFEKVHSDDISDFVVNHAEVNEKFGKYHPIPDD